MSTDSTRDIFTHDYDLNALVKIKTKRFGFELYTTPRLSVAYFDNVYEEATARFVGQAAKNISTFIDVGACYGFYSVLVGTSNPRCDILAFEPVTENYDILRRNLDLNGIKAKAYPYAVSDRQGRHRFQISLASDNSGIIASPALAVSKSIEVEVVKLDQYRDKIANGPVLIKIDTEGNELKVLDGIRKIIDLFDDLRLVVEFSPLCLSANGNAPEALLHKLVEFGFDIIFIDDNIRQYDRFDPKLDWRTFCAESSYKNLLCVRKGRPLSLDEELLMNYERQLAEQERLLTQLQSEVAGLHAQVIWHENHNASEKQYYEQALAQLQSEIAGLRTQIEWHENHSASEKQYYEEALAEQRRRTANLTGILETLRKDRIYRWVRRLGGWRVLDRSIDE